MKYGKPIDQKIAELINGHRYSMNLKALGYTDDELMLIQLVVPDEPYENDPEYDQLKRTPEAWPVIFSKKINKESKTLEIAYARMKWAMASTDKKLSHQLFQKIADDEAHRTLQQTSEKNRENARQPRTPRIDSNMRERIVDMGRRLAASGARHEITGKIQQQILGAPDAKTIRNILRETEIIPPAKKRGVSAADSSSVI